MFIIATTTADISRHYALTWLSHEVATKKLALGLKLMLEMESSGGLTTSVSLLGFCSAWGAADAPGEVPKPPPNAPAIAT